MKEINLIKNNSNEDLSDLEWAVKVYEYLQSRLKISPVKAFDIIYYLQEYFSVIPDHIEKCSVCHSLYDSWESGHHCDARNKFYCSDDCEWHVTNRRGKCRNKNCCA